MTEIAHELADDAIYLVELAGILGIDLSEAISEKLAINEAKYPAEKTLEPGGAVLPNGAGCTTRREMTL